MNSTNEDLIEFAKDQCEIFPEDSYMGKYLRGTLKMLEERTLAESSNDVMWNSVLLLNRLRTEYCSDDKIEYYKALSLAIQSIRKQMLDKLDVEFFTDLKNELLDKIKQTREEIENWSTYDGIYIDRADVLEILDKLIEEEEE